MALPRVSARARRLSWQIPCAALAALLVVTVADDEGGATDAERFRIAVTGDAELVLAFPKARYRFRREETEGLPVSYVLTFQNFEEGARAGVTIVFYADEPPPSGTHAISLEIPDSLENQVLALFADRETLTTYGQSNGSVVLEADADGYNGRFAFDAMTALPGTEEKSVTVTGEFEGLAVSD